MSVGRILTQGLGSFGGASYLLTLGLGDFEDDAGGGTSSLTLCFDASQVGRAGFVASAVGLVGFSDAEVGRPGFTVSQVGCC